jgi:dTDP-4-dehydrorhamnose reductase
MTESNGKRILVLGGSGMLGHKLVQSWSNRFDVWTTLRASFSRYERFRIFDKNKTIAGVNVDNFDSVVNAFAQSQPDAVVNCIGVIKQLKTAKDPIPTLTTNAIFPHRLANLCKTAGARLITLSTDCVFSGRKGNYTEQDVPDAEDLYGRSKNMGEVEGDDCLTVRTSIIGRELESAHSLVEWFLSNRGSGVCGFTKAIYSGFPTIVLADVLANLIENYPKLNGVWQVSSEPVNKYELLLLIRRAYNLNIEIEPDDDFQIDRSLDSSRFRRETGFAPPSWEEMIDRMAADPTPYDEWRKTV